MISAVAGTMFIASFGILLVHALDALSSRR